MTRRPAPPPLVEPVADRRSHRAFAERPLPDAVLASLFEAARWAPSSNNLQPWRFVLARAGTPAFERLAGALRPGNAWAKRAPVLVLGAARTMLIHPRKPPRPNPRPLLELGLALGNLLAQATALGVATHPMGGFDVDAAGEAMGVEDGFRVGIVVALGWPGDPQDLDPELRAKELRPRERRPLREIVYEGRWGEEARFAAEGA